MKPVIALTLLLLCLPVISLGADPKIPANMPALNELQLQEFLRDRSLMQAEEKAQQLREEQLQAADRMREQGVLGYEAHLTIAAQNGDVPSQRQLGIMYMTGKGLEYDPVKAHHWFSAAAAQGDHASVRFLEMYFPNQ